MLSFDLNRHCQYVRIRTHKDELRAALLRLQLGPRHHLVHVHTAQ